MATPSRCSSRPNVLQDFHLLKFANYPVVLRLIVRPAETKQKGVQGLGVRVQRLGFRAGQSKKMGVDRTVLWGNSLGFP